MVTSARTPSREEWLYRSFKLLARLATDSFARIWYLRGRQSPTNKGGMQKFKLSRKKTPCLRLYFSEH